ncbi:transposable element Tcb2 transposase [Trichonephila clavipes]|nr:transposable element Tcb2 transposase [Trichonephila clavipes]
MVWGVIAYNTRSPLVLIPGHPATTCVGTHTTVPRSHFQQDNARPHTARMSQNCLCTVTTHPWPARFRDLSPIEHLGSFGTASWASHGFERTTGKVTGNMERNVPRHHTELVCLNARSYRIVHSR